MIGSLADVKYLSIKAEFRRKKSSFFISKESQTFFGTLNEGNSPVKKIEVSSSLIENFLFTLNENIYEKIDLESLGLTYSFLEERVDMKYSSEIKGLVIKDEAEFKNQFYDHFFNISYLEKSIPNVFYYDEEFNTMNLPKIKVEVILNDKLITLSSTSGSPLMLPWEIKDEFSSQIYSFNPHISKSLGKILPDLFLLKSSLEGESGIESIIVHHVDHIMTELHSYWSWQNTLR